MKKIPYLLIAAFCVTFSVQAQYDPDALKILDAMSEKYKQIDAFTANFTQTMTNESADLNETISGEITVKDEMYVLKVAGQEIYNNGEDIYSYNPELEEVTVDTYHPEDQEITLSNIYDLYKDGFKYALLSTNKAGEQTIELDPESKNKSYFKIRMVIDQRNDLKTFTVYERSGNQYHYTIKNFTEKPDVNDQYFTFNPADYPSVEVIDFR